MHNRIFAIIASGFLFLASCTVVPAPGTPVNSSLTKKAEITGIKIETVTPSDNWDGNNLYLEKGLSEKLKAVTSFSDGATNNEVVWESSDPKIVAVDQTGNITALADGEAVIKATARQDATKNATVKILVAKVPVLDIEERSSLRITVKDKQGNILRDVSFTARLAADNSEFKLENIKFENDMYIISNLPLKEITLTITKAGLGSETIMAKPVSNLTGENTNRLTVIIGS